MPRKDRGRIPLLGALEDITDLTHSVGECYRCGTAVEPLVSPQWFVKMKPLAEPAIKAVEDGEIRFIPSVSPIFILIGWKTSAIGAFPASYGGDTVFCLVLPGLRRSYLPKG